MRKPRDFDAELQALTNKAKSLRDRKLRHLGELVIATGADALDADTLAGGLLTIVEANDPTRRESWRKRGQAFFQRKSHRTADGAAGDSASAPPDDFGAASL